MNHGCTVMTGKQRGSLCSGRRRPLCDQKKACQVRSNIKSVLIIFFDIRRIVPKEFVPPGQTVNGNFYCKVLRWLRESVRHKQPEMWKNGDWLLHHDNALAHTSLVVREFLTKNNMTTVPHPAYAPDLASCNFYVFPKMKLRLKGWCFLFHWKDPSKIATGTKHAKASRLPWVLSKMTKSLGSLCTSPWWLLRRWRWKLGLKLSIHVIMSKLPEILGRPSYSRGWNVSSWNHWKVEAIDLGLSQ